jgi:type IV secretion system protein VirD4
MSITSYETADMMSKRIGEETIVIRTEGDNRGSSFPIGGDGKNPGSRNDGSNRSFSEAARRVFKTEEILVLPEYTAMVFHKNHHVIVCNKIRYYADQAFRRRGMVFRRWGTGRTKGLGLGEMLGGLALLALSLGVTLFVARLPVLIQQPRVSVSDKRVESGSESGFAPARYRPARRTYGMRRMP